MQRPGNCRCLTAAEVLCLLALVSAFGSAAGLSLRPLLRDVDQDISAQDEAYYPEEPPELDLDPPDVRSESNEKRAKEWYVKIVSSPKGGDLSIAMGGRLELTCEVNGSPAPLVFWVRDGVDDYNLAVQRHSTKPFEEVANDKYKSMALEVSKLIIDNVTSNDNGEYYCVALAPPATGDRRVESNRTKLEVDEGAFKYGKSTLPKVHQTKPEITLHRPYYLSEKGSTVVLPCTAKGNPTPHVSWYNNTMKIKMGERFSINQHNSLVIRDLRWEDMGSYKCVASSSKGMAQAETFLYPAKRSSQ